MNKAIKVHSFLQLFGFLFLTGCMNIGPGGSSASPAALMNKYSGVNLCP
jgi:hypothetical protein